MERKGILMRGPLIEFESRFDFEISANLSWWDRESQCTIVISSPTADPALWAKYLEGAQASYRRHGVERALDVGAIRDGSDTLMFWAAVAQSDRIIGGVRAKGPLRCAEDSHAVVEWTNHRGLRAVRKMITDRVPFGILEMKSAWIDDDRDRAHPVARVLARSGFHAMAIMDVQFCMATAAPHVLERWSSSGGVVAPIPAAPYPDESYRTKMMWWDKRTFAKHAEPDQIKKILLESDSVVRLAMAR
jgi:hypothetical protein